MWRALLAYLGVFGAAIVLMLAIVRWRSNIARWLVAVPLTLLVLFYDLSHLQEEMALARGALVYLAVLRLGLIAAAVWSLFTAPVRAWFSGRQAAEK